MPDLPRALCLALAVTAGALVGAPLHAADREPVFEATVRIRDHRFVPETVEVPAGRRVKLVVRNEDPTVEEFESHDLGREKLVTGGATVMIYVGPLQTGEYVFFGEYHQESAHGRIVAR
jgi:plastocyanin